PQSADERTRAAQVNETLGGPGGRLGAGSVSEDDVEIRNADGHESVLSQQRTGASGVADDLVQGAGDGERARSVRAHVADYQALRRLLRRRGSGASVDQRHRVLLEDRPDVIPAPG